MPVKPENRARYPADWPAIRRMIQARARNRCERCGVQNYSVGHREADGSFVPLCGNGPCDFAGRGLAWPSGEPLTYSEAREFAGAQNVCGQHDDDGNRWIVIVCTVAHVNDPDPANCDDSNLAFLCQRDHNLLDAKMRARNAAETRRGKDREKVSRTPVLFAG